MSTTATMAASVGAASAAGRNPRRASCGYKDDFALSGAGEIDRDEGRF